MAKAIEFIQENFIVAFTGALILVVFLVEPPSSHFKYDPLVYFARLRPALLNYSLLEFLNLVSFCLSGRLLSHFRLLRFAQQFVVQMVVFDSVATEIAHRMALSPVSCNALDESIDALQDDDVLEVDLRAKLVTGYLKLLIKPPLSRVPTIWVFVPAPAQAATAG